jgi:hypothetical protein
MKHLWEGLLVASLAVIGLLSFRLMRSEQENRRLTQTQKALVVQVEAMGRRLPKADSADARSAERQASDAEAARKAEHDALVAAWQKRYAEFRHKDMLRFTWFRYHDVLAKMNLPRDKQAQVLDLLCARTEAGNDAREAAAAAGITDASEYDRVVAAANAEVGKDIAGVVGDSGLEALDNSQAVNMQVMGIERSVGADLAMDGIPLTPDQESALAQIYVDVSKQYSTSSYDGFHGTSDMTRPQPDGEALVISRASAILSPEQMAGLKSYLDFAGQRSKVLAEAPK